MHVEGTTAEPLDRCKDIVRCLDPAERPGVALQANAISCAEFGPPKKASQAQPATIVTVSDEPEALWGAMTTQATLYAGDDGATFIVFGILFRKDGRPRQSAGYRCALRREEEERSEVEGGWVHLPAGDDEAGIFQNLEMLHDAEARHR